MHRVDTQTAVAEMPAQNAPGDPGYFTQGSPALGQAATVPGQDWFNSVQEELANVVEGAGVELDKAAQNQVLQAILSLIVTNAPLGRGYIGGLQVITAADADHDRTILAGICRDSSNTFSLNLAAPLTKQIDAAWAAGNNNGGCLSNSGVVQASTWYHYFLLRKDLDKSIDAGWSTSIICSDIPEGYTAYKRIRSHKTDGSANIIPDVQAGDLILWTTPPALDIDVSDLSTAKVEYTLASVPPGVRVEALANAVVLAESNAGAYIHPTDLADTAPSIAAAPLVSVMPCGALGGTLSAPAHIQCLTDTSAKIAARAMAAGTTLRVQVRGYYDRRGRDD